MRYPSDQVKFLRETLGQNYADIENSDPFNIRLDASNNRAKVVYISGYIGRYPSTSREVSRIVDDMDGDFTVAISSGGGVAWEGAAIYNILSSYDRGTITTRIDSIAASAAGFIFMAGTHRLMFDGTSTLGMHEASAFSFVEGTVAKIKIKVADLINALETMNKFLVSEIARITNKDEIEAAKMITEETKFFNYKEASDNGLATGKAERKQRIIQPSQNAGGQFRANIAEAESVLSRIGSVQ